MHAVNYPSTTLPPPADPAEAEEHVWKPDTNVPKRRGRTLRLAALAAGLLAAGALIGMWLGGGRDSEPVVAPDPGGFAEMYVGTLLTQAGEGNEEVLIPYLGYAPDLSGIESGSWYVPQAAAWSVTREADGIWNVVVAVAQLGRADGGYTPAGTYFYQVGIEATDSGLRAMALPSMTMPPAPGPADRTGQVIADEPLRTAVSEYLRDHHGAGAGSPIHDVALGELTLESIDDGRRQVLVRYASIDEAGRATPLAQRLAVSGAGSAGTGYTVEPISPGSS